MTYSAISTVTITEIGRHHRDQRDKRACNVDTGVDEPSRGAVDALLMYLPLRLQHEIADEVLDQQQGEERDRGRGHTAPIPVGADAPGSTCVSADPNVNCRAA